MIRIFLIVLIVQSACFTGKAQTLPDSIAKTTRDMTPKEQVEYLGQLCWSQRELNAELALDIGQAAINIGKSNNLTSQLARIHNYVGVVYVHYLFDAKNAISHFHQAFDLASAVKDSVQIGYAYNNLGDVFYLTGNPVLSKDYAQKSLEIFQSVGFKPGIAYGYSNLGLAYKIAKEYDKALESFQKTIDISIEINDNNNHDYALLEIARIYHEQEKYEEALEYYKASLKMHQQIGNKVYAAQCLTGIGDIFYVTGEYEKALVTYRESLQLNRIRDERFGIISNYLGMALVYSKTGNAPEGRRKLNEATEMAKELGYSSKILESYEAGIEFSRNLGDYQEASAALEQFVKNYDSVFSYQQFETFKEIEDRFQSRLKLTRANQEIDIKNQQKIFLILTLILLAVILLVIFWRYRSHKFMNLKLTESNEAKDKLFSIISHDLRNPFVALAQYVELLKEEDITEEQKKYFIRDLDKRTKQTYGLLENLLNLSASRIGKLDFSPADFDFEKVIDTVLELYEPQINEKSIHISKSLDVKDIYGDQNMIETIVRNLFSNAIKFSPKDAEIIISSSVDEQYYNLSVRDTGKGMDEETRNSIFKTDFVKSKLGTSGEKGTGIGLSLCKEFVDIHNGKIEVESAPGKGSSFTVSLPLPISR